MPLDETLDIADAGHVEAHEALHARHNELEAFDPAGYSPIAHDHAASYAALAHGTHVTDEIDTAAHAAIDHTGITGVGGGGGDSIAAEVSATAISIASTSPITVASVSVPAVTAGDLITLEVWGVLINSSGSRAYDLDVALGAFNLGAAAGTSWYGITTSALPRVAKLEAVFSVVSSSLVRAWAWAPLASASGYGSISATPQAVNEFGAAEGTNNLTGAARTLTFSITSDSAAATQTFTPYGIRVKRGT